MRSRHDENQLAIRRWLEKCGWDVVFTTGQGAGFPDAVARCGSIIVLVEFKVDCKHPPETQLNKQQVAFHERWRGAPIYILRNELDCLELYAKEMKRLSEVFNER
jgi:Holliday junction resolvase